MCGAVVALHAAPLVALKWLLMFHTYLRPGECDKLTVGQLVRPTPAARHALYQQWGILLHPAGVRRQARRRSGAKP